MTFSPFDHPILGGLVGDEEIAGYFSMQAELHAMLDVEVALARAQAKTGVIPAKACGRIETVARGFKPDVEQLRLATSRDGVPVPELVRQLREAVGGEAAGHVHFGATSQDVVDTALMLRLKPVVAILETRLSVLDSALGDLDRRFGRDMLTGYTRMQPAIDITAADRIGAWRAPIDRNRSRLDAWAGDNLVVQFGGAAGTLDKLGGAASAIRAALATELGLADAPQWHSQRDRIADLGNVLSLVTGGLGKVGQDIALLAQSGAEIEIAGGGSSSAMPYKQNPVGAEVLVALARFNATQLSGLHHALVHEQERSGAAWTLEWLVLPQMICAAATSIRSAIELAGNVRRLGRPA